MEKNFGRYFKFIIWGPTLTLTLIYEWGACSMAHQGPPKLVPRALNDDVFSFSICMYTESSLPILASLVSTGFKGLSCTCERTRHSSSLAQPSFLLFLPKVLADRILVSSVFNRPRNGRSDSRGGCRGKSARRLKCVERAWMCGRGRSGPSHTLRESGAGRERRAGIFSSSEPRSRDPERS